MKHLLKLESVDLLKQDMSKLTAVELDQLPKLVIETHSKLQEKEQNNQKEKMNRLLAQSQKALELKKTYEEHTKLFAFE